MKKFSVKFGSIIILIFAIDPFKWSIIYVDVDASNWPSGEELIDFSFNSKNELFTENLKFLHFNACLPPEPAYMSGKDKSMLLPSIKLIGNSKSIEKLTTWFWRTLDI